VIFGVAAVFPVVIAFGVDVPAPNAGTLLVVIRMEDSFFGDKRQLAIANNASFFFRCAISQLCHMYGRYVRAVRTDNVDGQPYVRPIRTAVENELPYVRTSYVRAVRTARTYG